MTITQLSLSYRHSPAFSSPCHYQLSSSCHYPRHSLLSVITRLDRVIPLLPPPILRMPRSSRSMTGWNDNYSTSLFLIVISRRSPLSAIIPRHSLLSVITRLDRVIPLRLPPIPRMPRSSRSMTGWNDNYQLPLSYRHFLTSSLFLPLSPTFTSPCHYPT